MELSTLYITYDEVGRCPRTFGARQRALILKLRLVAQPVMPWPLARGDTGQNTRNALISKTSAAQTRDEIIVNIRAIARGKDILPLQNVAHALSPAWRTVPRGLWSPTSREVNLILDTDLCHYFSQSTSYSSTKGT